ncbi:MAG: class I SAM-dependent methyltransferase [Anaerolineales bacterium]|nr:class I SAM-dependent methyltransferase [Anaerolineales bacterium]
MTFFDHMEATRPYQWLRAWMNRGLVRFLTRRVLNAGSDLRVAELACGSGHGAHLLAQLPQVALSIAADINQEDHRQAGFSDFAGQFVLLDLFKPALAPASLDLAWNSSSIEELDQPVQAVQAMARLLKPGGRLFIGVPNRHGPAGWLGRIADTRHKAWLGRDYNRAELHSLMAESGLTVELDTSYLFGVFIGVVAQKPD